jgi:hypothetical protein
MTSDSSDDYDVGFKKPPTHTQFKKGQSGNPKGRPKGSTNLKTEINKVFDERIPVQRGGRQRFITGKRAVLTKIRNAGINGDGASLRLSVRLMEMADAEAPIVTTLFESADDVALLHSVLRDQGLLLEASTPASSSDTKSNSEEDPE